MGPEGRAATSSDLDLNPLAEEGMRGHHGGLVRTRTRLQ